MEIGAFHALHGRVVGRPSARRRTVSEHRIKVGSFKKIRCAQISRQFVYFNGKGVVCHNTAGLNCAVFIRVSRRLLIGGKAARVMDICFQNTVKNLTRGVKIFFLSRAAVHLSNSHYDVHTFPTRFGGEIVFAAVQCVTNIVARRVAFKILFDISGKIQIFRLLRFFVQNTENMVYRKICLRPADRHKGRPAVVKLSDKQSRRLFGCRKILAASRYIVPQHKTVHNMIVRPGVPCLPRFFGALGKGAAEAALF